MIVEEYIRLGFSIFITDYHAYLSRDINSKLKINLHVYEAIKIKFHNTHTVASFYLFNF